MQLAADVGVAAANLGGAVPVAFVPEQSERPISGVATMKAVCKENYCHELGSDQSVTLIFFTKRLPFGSAFRVKKGRSAALGGNV